MQSISLYRKHRVFASRAFCTTQHSSDNKIQTQRRVIAVNPKHSHWNCNSLTKLHLASQPCGLLPDGSVLKEEFRKKKEHIS